ncbi:oca4p [Saccharomyces arboricola H-6]|uniref:Oca4p n=1 Tax=Saccharomyces arboricola (strain H-6 / AS 2.3317 / CBS 10644) TaxID=1160507 RepID=J8Q769_SACAR|nr:oca4p [Saccharomyces arboricola H-6]
MLVPPANFGIAEEGIYRCSKMETLNLSFLETLNLKTAIFIGGQEPSKFFKDFFTRSSIKWIVLRMSDFSAAAVPVKNPSESNGNLYSSNISSLSLQDEKKAKNSNTPQNSVIIEPAIQNEVSYHLSDNDDLMLIKSTCLKRTFKILLNVDNFNVLLVDKTALIIGILRKIQKWNIASIINEYRLFSGKNKNYFAETFLEIIGINIEQEKNNKTITNKNNKKLSLENINRTHSIEYKANSGKLVKVNEDDLCKEPEVPKRLLTLINQIETKVKNNKILQVKGVLGDDLKRTSSDLGIFGHRYRLAFNKRENGEYGYYKAKGKDNIIIRIPSDSELPDWFKFQRDLWEKENVPEEHHFYREHIFT